MPSNTPEPLTRLEVNSSSVILEGEPDKAPKTPSGILNPSSFKSTSGIVKSNPFVNDSKRSMEAKSPSNVLAIIFPNKK